MVDACRHLYGVGVRAVAAVGDVGGSCVAQGASAMHPAWARGDCELGMLSCG